MAGLPVLSPRIIAGSLVFLEKIYNQKIPFHLQTHVLCDKTPSHILALMIYNNNSILYTGKFINRFIIQNKINPVPCAAYPVNNSLCLHIL